MENLRVTFAFSSRIVVGLTCLGLIAGCSSVENLLAGDKIDYKSSSTTRTNSLEVPPDLTQLSRESRYQQPGGTVSASAFQAATATATAATAAPAATTVAPQSIGAFKIERLGNDRWLSTTLPPEAVYPQVKAFWKDNGFNIVQDRADAGVLETDWAENRAKLPSDLIRNTIGKVFDSAYSTGELDKFNTRIERTATGSDIYITHRGMEEVYVGARKDATSWQPRPTDPQLEATFLARLMVKLGAKDEQAKAVVAASGTGPVAPARARALDGLATPTLQVDDNFDRAWRRVGIALDRSGFTVEDRDRAQGLYFVRYVDPSFAGREEPGFFSRLFSGSKKNESGLARYRVKVTSEGSASTVAVLDSQGKPETSANGKRIVALLLEDLR
ncbi:MAG: outer membrane protein assembly factor BamC [Caldimonas sp.]